MRRHVGAGALLLGLGLLVGCADEIPGVSPPADQLYFPHALLTEPGAGHLIAVSSNFDQRYNAGRVHVFDTARLLSLVPADRAEVHFIEGFGDAHLGSLRIDQFAGDILLTAPIQAFEGSASARRLLIPSRGRNLLTMLDYDPTQAMPLSCGGAPEAPSRFDCADVRMVGTGDQDPYSLTGFTTQSGAPMAVVAHLRSRTNTAQLFQQSLAVVDLERFAARVESGAPEELASPVSIQTFNMGGTTGVAFLPPGMLGASVSRDEGTLVTLGANRSTRLLLSGFRLQEVGDRDYRFGAGADRAFDLSGSTDAQASRGLVYDAPRGRLYLSLRFPETADSFNSAIAVVDPTGSDFVLVSLTEVGEELGRPALRVTADGTRLLYVPDIRRHTVWILDVTTDQPVVLHKVDGIGTRTFDGVPVQVRVLSAPSQIAFADDGQGGTFAFVSNFANSTLAVLDVTDPDPRRHAVVARLGRDIDAEGEKEGP